LGKVGGGEWGEVAKGERSRKKKKGGEFHKGEVGVRTKVRKKGGRNKKKGSHCARGPLFLEKKERLPGFKSMGGGKEHGGMRIVVFQPGTREGTEGVV